MKINQIIEGWKNHLLPEERTKTYIDDISLERLAICNECEEHSSNKEGYTSLRIDAHCTNCGCTLSAKTKCLTCECPLKKWMATEMPTEDVKTT